LEPPVDLAKACAARNLPIVTLAGDVLTHEDPQRVYLHTDPPAAAEAAVFAANSRALVIRAGELFSPGSANDFAGQMRAAVIAGRPFEAANDELVSPAYLPDLVEAVLDLAIDQEAGVWGLTSGETLTRAAFAVRIARALAADATLVRPMPHASLRRPFAHTRVVEVAGAGRRDHALGGGFGRRR
jgi:dTDP-4-dehydrorhamnose reductase